MRLWVTGYRSYELNVFKEKDPKKEVIMTVIKNNLKNRLDNGLTWVLTGGQLGVEQWTIEAGLELKKSNPGLHLALILPFAEFGGNWQPDKQQHLNNLKEQVDFCATVSNAPYRSPQQLKNYQKFMLEHTEGALLIYDPEYSGKTHFDHQAIVRQQERSNYELELIDMLDLEDTANELAENKKEEDSG